MVRKSSAGRGDLKKNRVAGQEEHNLSETFSNERRHFHWRRFVSVRRGLFADYQRLNWPIVGGRTRPLACSHWAPFIFFVVVISALVCASALINERCPAPFHRSGGRNIRNLRCKMAARLNKIFAPVSLVATGLRVVAHLVPPENPSKDAADDVKRELSRLMRRRSIVPANCALIMSVPFFVFFCAVIDV